MSHVTFEQAFSKAFAHIGAAMDIFQSIPRPNGATTAALSNGPSVKALPAPKKVKKAAAKALPAAPAEAAAPVAAKPEKAKAASKAIVKAKAAPKAKPVKAKAASKAIVKAAKAAKPVKAKAAPKAKGAPANAIAAGRRAVAEGLRPKLVDAIAIVMGKETVTAGTILERLTARGWQPGASNPQSYISFTLSANADTFKRGKRGEYSVKDAKKFEAIAANFKAGKAPAAPKAAKAAAPKAAKSKGAGSKKSGKAEGVASTDAGVAEAVTAPQASEETTVEEVAAEAAPVAGDPPTQVPDATAQASTESPTTTQALVDLGMGETEVSENPFDALNS